MSKSPEEYFTQQNFSSEDNSGNGFSQAERAFMDKYLGVDEGQVLQKIGLAGPGAVKAEPDLHKEMSAEETIDEVIRKSDELQMVSFFIGGQEFTVPTIAVQEVIRSIPAAKLPSSPDLVAGVINLRGKVTPLVHLRDLLEVSSPRISEDKFIIVCRRHGLQIGLIIERIHTMYHVRKEEIDWGIEAHLGINVDFIAGLLKLNDQLVSIVSIDRIIESILK